MEPLPVRKPTRLPQFDYSRDGVYFVTICAYEKRNWFGKVDLSGKMELSTLGKLANKNLLAIPQHRPNVRLHHYVVMPNHIHILLEICSDAGRDTTCRVRTDEYNRFGPMHKGSLSAIVGSYKAAVTRAWRETAATTSRGPTERLKDVPLWQSRYHDHVVRNEGDFLRIWQYIDNNPARWAEDRYYVP